MSRFENLKYHEISEKLNISVNTVKYHMKNALSKLNSDLKKYLITWSLLLYLSEYSVKATISESNFFLFFFSPHYPNQILNCHISRENYDEKH